MNCPVCKKPTWEHDDNHIIHFEGGMCYATEMASYRAAQRAAAIAHLKGIGARLLKFKRYGVRTGQTRNEIFTAIAAYRAVGILPERKP